jgi:hypothetical protein
MYLTKIKVYLFDGIFATAFLALAVAAIARESQMASLGYNLGYSGYIIGTLAASGVYIFKNNLSYLTFSQKCFGLVQGNIYPGLIVQILI